MEQTKIESIYTMKNGRWKKTSSILFQNIKGALFRTNEWHDFPFILAVWNHKNQPVLDLSFGKMPISQNPLSSNKTD